MSQRPVVQIALFVGLLACLFSLGTNNVTHAAPNLVADYRFDNSRASSVGTAPALVDLGTNTFISDTVDSATCTVLAFASGDGLSLATAGVIASDNYSLVLLFRFDTTSGYQKIVDFKNGTADTGLYNLSQRLLTVSTSLS